VLRSTNVGSGSISSVSLRDAEPLYLELLHNDPNFFIEAPFNRERVTTEFVADRMVAL
jgi:hypothetical protein